MDWQEFFFDPDLNWVERLERLARRRFPDSTMADQAYTYAFEELSRDGWARLSNFKGQSSPGTYLQKVISSLLEDYSRKCFGRPRPPAWLKRLGPIWTKVWRLLCLERLDLEQIKDFYVNQSDALLTQVEEAAGIIKAKVPRCGEHVGEVNVEEFPERESEGVSDPLDPPDVQRERDDFLHITQALSLLLDPSKTSEGNPSDTMVEIADRLEGRLSELGSQLARAVSDDQLLLLRLVYQQNQPVSKAAKMLGMHDHTARRALHAGMERLREELKAFGIGPDDLE